MRKKLLKQGAFLTWIKEQKCFISNKTFIRETWKTWPRPKMKKHHLSGWRLDSFHATSFMFWMFVLVDWLAISGPILGIITFLDAIASPSTYPCQSVGEWLIVSACYSCTSLVGHNHVVAWQITRYDSKSLNTGTSPITMDHYGTSLGRHHWLWDTNCVTQCALFGDKYEALNLAAAWHLVDTTDSRVRKCRSGCAGMLEFELEIIKFSLERIFSLNE